ncbi:hypothetical protein C6501_10365 [Candidatus Poribacteria bacterium]|nr:MAG: hypothetical protein C6501_10365 [Candidatus Poribacteria bacterium]
MASIVNIGRRIELVPIDPHFNDITIALYRQQQGERAVFRVHTYSRIEGAATRIEDVVQSMKILGGMQERPDGMLCFPCGERHEAACRRVFLEACKLEPNTSVEPRPLNTLDKKSKLTITVDSMGNGTYRVKSNGEGRPAERRVSAIAGGLIKLGEMEAVNDKGDSVAFPCGQSHDELVGLLLVRAPNVRVILRQEEASASRGVLSAPSQQT